MYTIQQVAHEIEQIKPNFTEFLEALVNKSSEEFENSIWNEPNIFIKLLKAELGVMYFKTHTRRWCNTADLYNVLKDNLSIPGGYSYSSYSNYVIKNSFDSSYHILAHIEDPKPYLPKYLWDKVRTVRRLNKEPIKQLQPDAMSLHVFKTYLQNRKNLTSAEATLYLEQLKDFSFDSIREDFMDVIFSKCPKPSIELQKNFAGQIWNNKVFVLPTQNSPTLYKYMTLSRNHVRNLANKLKVPITTAIYDTLDSSYKPFITGLYRTPDTKTHELSYLFSALVLFQSSVLQEPNPVYSYFIECLTKHLQAPESASQVNKLKQNFSLINQAVNQLPF